MLSHRWTIVQLLATTLLIAAPPYQAARHNVDTGCRFPEKWEGTWFQSGVRQPITIQESRLSTKGRCLAAEGDKFLLVDDKGVCFRCVVIHEKHENVLQYKETYCLHSRDSLHSLCSLITGDALLYSMFREAASPVPCPFRGAHTFTYNRGHGECRWPVSSIDSCTQDSRLLLRYQACPDVHGTESTVEELECLATWKEGSSRYLVGKVHHSHATSNEDRYRCFVYEKSVSGGVEGEGIEGRGRGGVAGGDDTEYRVAQSGDATCNGLFSPMEGSRTMTLKKGELAAVAPNKCRFPTWLTASSHWHTLDYRRSYSLHHRNTTLRIANTTAGGSGAAEEQEIRVLCTEVRQAAGDVAHLVTHYTMGCQSGFMCMIFYKRDTHVIEVQTGTHTRRAEEACDENYFDHHSVPYVTLVTTNPEQRRCPHFGKFSVSGVSRRERYIRSHTASDSVEGHGKGSTVRRSGDSTIGREGEYRGWATVYEQSKEYQLDPDQGYVRSFLDHSNSRLKRDFERLIQVLGSRDDNNKLKRSASGGSVAVSDFSVSDSDGRERAQRDLESFSASDACSLDFKTLMVGCGALDTMEFRSDCSAPATNIVSAYSCHGGWSENGTHYLITTPLSRSSHGARRYCFVYSAPLGNTVRFSTSADTCRRDLTPGATGVLAFNITSQGLCTEVNSAPLAMPSLQVITLITVLHLRYMLCTWSHMLR